MRFAPPLCVLALLSACGALTDAEQARQCRAAISALNPPGTTVRLVSTGPGSRPRSVRIDYHVIDPNGIERLRHVVCLFGGEELAGDTARMTGIATERGPLADAAFYFLRRFYLEASKDAPPDPARAAFGAGAVEIPRPLAYALQQLVAALPLASVYGLLAAAYALVFGLIGRINLAFGAFLALGGTAAIMAAGGFLASGIDVPAMALLAGLAVAVFVGGLHGFAASRLVLGPLRRASGQALLIATVGMALALAEYLRLMQGPSARWLAPLWNAPLALARAGDFVVTVTPMGLGVAATALATGLALLALLRFSVFGRAWRACADDPLAAALFGVDPERVLDATLVMGCALAGLCGELMVAFHGGLGVAAGFALGLKALVGAVLGGIGSVPGALLGGLAIGFGEALWSAVLPIDTRDIAIYALLAVVLALRPAGLLGRPDL